MFSFKLNTPFGIAGRVCAHVFGGREARSSKNSETCHMGKVISYHAVSEEWFLLSSLVLPPLEQLIEKEQILELMGLLTERQRDIVILYFYYGDSQKKDSPSGKKADFKRVK